MHNFNSVGVHLNCISVIIYLPYLLLIAIVNQHFQNDIENICFVVNYCILYCIITNDREQEFERKNPCINIDDKVLQEPARRRVIGIAHLDLEVGLWNIWAMVVNNPHQLALLAWMAWGFPKHHIARISCKSFCSVRSWCCLCLLLCLCPCKFSY